MQKTLEFRTKLSREKLIEILKKNTHYTESITPPILFFGKEYFFGQVGEERIRIGKTELSGKGAFPIYEIFLTSEEGYTHVLVQDDTEEKINMAKVLLISITIAICFVFFTTGTVLSFKHPETFSFFWTVMVCLVVATFGTIGVYLNRSVLVSRKRKDLNYLQSLLKSK